MIVLLHMFYNRAIDSSATNINKSGTDYLMNSELVKFFKLRQAVVIIKLQKGK